MIIDQENLKILKGFYGLKKEEGLWELTKKLFPECKTEPEISGRYIFIQRRIKKMDDGLFKIENINGCSKFILSDHVVFCRHKLPCGYKECAIIKLEGKWNIFEL